MEIMEGYAHDAFFANDKNTAGLILKDGLYYKNGAVVVPNVKSLKLQILKGLHDASYAGHVGHHRTRKSVQRLYWWPAMGTQIAEYVKGCEVCQRNKNSQSQPSGGLVPLPIPKESWDVVTSDASLTCLRRSQPTPRFGSWSIS